MVSQRIQEGLNIVKKWCKDIGLSVISLKTVVVPFTLKRYDNDELRRLKLFNQYLQYSDKVIYLGMYLDSKLNWNEHLNYVTNKATMALWTCKSIIGKKWGIKPRTAKWIHTSIILPIMPCRTIA